LNKAQKPGAPKPIKEVSMLQASRKAVKREVKKAKDAWLAGVVSDLEGRDNPKDQRRVERPCQETHGSAV
jgi:hypothetical protein